MTSEKGFASLLVLLLLIIIGALVYFFIVVMNPFPGRSFPFDLDLNAPNENETIQEKVSEDQSKTGKQLLFDHGEFSFMYSDKEKLYQQGINVIFWNSNPLPESYDYPTMFLRWSEKPFPPLTDNGPFTIYKTVYPAEETHITITSPVEKEEITLGPRKETMYSFTCGVDCYYHVVRFQLGDTYYELVRDGAGGGIYGRFLDLLSTFRFYEPNEKKRFTSKEGKYSVEYFAKDILYENAKFSVDGVINYSASTIMVGNIAINYFPINTNIDVFEYI